MRFILVATIEMSVEWLSKRKSTGFINLFQVTKVRGCQNIFNEACQMNSVWN